MSIANRIPPVTQFRGAFVNTALAAVVLPQLASAGATGAELESVSIPDKVGTPTEYVSMWGKAFNMVFPNDTNHFKILDNIIEWKSIDTIGPDIRGEIGAIDIAKGKAFQTDGWMTMPPTAAGTLGDASARTIALKASRRSP